MTTEAQEPRHRPFRAASWALYLLVSVGFSSLIIFSVFKSVISMTPEMPAPSGAGLSEQECVERARQLFEELETQRKMLAESPDVSSADQAFLRFRIDWLQRKRNIEGQCGLGSRVATRELFATLERVLDLYTTASVQFAGAVGPTVNALKLRLAPPAP
jgi:hypothetical protein